MKNFLHKIAYVLVMCAAMSAFTACSDSDNKGGGPLTGTLSVETGSLKFTSGTYSKGFEVKTDGTVGAIQVDVNYKGSETGWITAKVNDGDVVVTVARNTGDARTADVVLSAKGAESVTVSISQKAVFSSDLVGRYTPYVPDPENPIANFFINPVYADMDSEKVPQIDMGFLFGVPGYTWPVTTVTGLANQLVGMMYGGGLTYFDFKDDGTIGAGYRDMLGFDLTAGPTFGPEVEFPNAETLEVLPVDAITYYTKDGKVYFAIDKEYLTYIGQAELEMDLPQIIDTVPGPWDRSDRRLLCHPAQVRGQGWRYDAEGRQGDDDALHAADHFAGRGLPPRRGYRGVARPRIRPDENPGQGAGQLVARRAFQPEPIHRDRHRPYEIGRAATSPSPGRLRKLRNLLFSFVYLVCLNIIS